jgi:uncharacterized cupin superfamily protein
MTKHEHVIQLSEVPVDTINAPEGSAFGGRRQRVGMHVGAQRLGYSFFTVPPGKAAFPYHTHSGNEEMIYVIGGEGILRFGNEEITVYPHQLINTGAAELHYLVVSTMEYPDLSEYPDSNKVGAYASAAVGQKVGFRALYVRDKNANYYDGEDGKEIERIVKSNGRE